MNRLKNNRCYLAGPMEHEPDEGVSWRQNVQHALGGLDISWLDPTDKPIQLGREDRGFGDYLRRLKFLGQWELIAKEVKIIRSVDLRMVDISDFLIVNLNLDIQTCGTWEELFWANRCKKPCLVHVEQGKAFCPNWLFGVLPHELIFSDWQELCCYVRHIAQDPGPTIDDLNRWRFFELPGAA
jgi:nucleoside 2-deoxyribosyltransferase